MNNHRETNRTKKTERRKREMKTHSDDVIKSPRVLDGAAEIQAVEGLSQCTISVALGEFNYQGIRL